MSKEQNYQEILTSKIINAQPRILAKKLNISKITAGWFKKTVKARQQEIVKNEIRNLSTDDLAQKLNIPLELASWLKDTLEKEI